MSPSLNIHLMLRLPKRSVVTFCHSCVLQRRCYNDCVINGVGTKSFDLWNHVRCRVDDHGVLQRQHVGHPRIILLGRMFGREFKVSSDDRARMLRRCVVRIFRELSRKNCICRQGRIPLVEWHTVVTVVVGVRACEPTILFATACRAILSERITPVEPRHHSTTIRLIRRLPFRGTSQNHADSVQRDERGDDEKDRRTPGCSTRATTTTTTTTVSARIRFRSHDVFTREEH